MHNMWYPLGRSNQEGNDGKRINRASDWLRNYGGYLYCRYSSQHVGRPMIYGLYGRWNTRKKRAVLVKTSASREQLEALKRTFEARKKFGQLTIETIGVAK